MNSNSEEKFKINNSNDYIKNITAGITNTGSKIIENTLKKKLTSLNSQLKKIPELYKNLKNNVTVSNNQSLKKMNENIANTGNHTAGGYAVSKTLNNINAYNKNLSDLDKREREETLDIKNKINEAYSDAENKKLQLRIDAMKNEMEHTVRENERVDNLNFQLEGLKEEQKLNNHKIDMDNKESIRLDNKEKRETEEHNMNMYYTPLKIKDELKTGRIKNDLLIQQIKNLILDGNLTEENIKKIKNEIERQEEEKKKETAAYGETPENKKNSESKKTSSNKQSSVSNKGTTSSKMSAKDIANNIKSQVGKKSYDSYGKEVIKIDKLKAYALLMAWKKKYNLTEQVVNDASIHLGIQDFF